MTDLDQLIPSNFGANGLIDADGIAHLRLGFARPARRQRTNILTPTGGVIWVLRGAGHIHIDGKSHPLTAGSLFWRPRNKAHDQFLDQGEAAIIAFCGLPGGSSEFFQFCDLIGPNNIVRDVGIHEESILAFSQLIHRLSNGEEAAPIIVSALDIFQRLLKHKQTDQNDEQEFIDNAQRLLQKHACDRTALEHIIGDHSYISWRTRFRDLCGMSPGKYRIQARLKKACDLLSFSELSIKEISYQCGYDDVHNFARQFKKHYKLTPQQWRKAQAE